MLNLFLALIWLAFGVWLLYLHYFMDKSVLFLRFGWMAVVVATYNLVRGWSRLSTRQALDPAGTHPRHARHHHDEGPPNPDFDFTNQPPGPGPIDPPPSPR